MIYFTSLEGYHQSGVEIQLEKPCNTCGFNTAKPFLRVVTTKRSFHVVKCERCGLVYSDIILEPDHVLAPDASYRAHKVYSTQGELYMEEAQRYLASLKPLFKTGRVLDVGCGLGYFLAAARELGWLVEGIDISPTAIQEAKERFHLERVTATTVQSASFPNEGFDAICLWNSLEHMADPKGSIEKIVGWLKPEGLLAIEVPDHDGIMYALNHVMHTLTGGKISISKMLYGDVEGSHVYIYTEKSLINLLSPHGFQAVHLKRSNSTAKTLLMKYDFTKGFMKAAVSYVALYSGYLLASVTRKQNRLLMVFRR